jgi:hypothetical protein
LNDMLVFPWDQECGGVSSVVRNLALYLGQNGHHMVLLLPGDERGSGHGPDGGDDAQALNPCIMRGHAHDRLVGIRELANAPRVDSRCKSASPVIDSVTEADYARLSLGSSNRRSPWTPTYCHE